MKPKKPCAKCFSKIYLQVTPKYQVEVYKSDYYYNKSKSLGKDPIDLLTLKDLELMKDWVSRAIDFIQEKYKSGDIVL